MLLLVEVLWLICRLLYYDVEAFIRWLVPGKPKSVRGKVAVVTGGGRGIGREIAIQLARQGCKVAVWDVDENSCLETTNLIENSGGISIAYQCDVTKTKAVAEVAATVRKDLGEVDILVNNAGVLACKSILDLDEKDIRRTFEVNTVSQFWTVKEFLPHMLSKNDGHIVIIASMAAIGGHALLTDYTASKHAVDGFGEALYAELVRMKKTGVKMTTVYPMFVTTRLVTDLENRVEARDRFTPFLTPESVAKAVTRGVLHNTRYVYVPRKMRATNLLTFMPLKAQHAILGFMGTGFFEKAKSS